MANRGVDRAAGASPLLSFRCADCGYGARRRSSPHRCPLCGCTQWEEEGWTPFSTLLDLTTAEAEEEASTPLHREALEVDASGVFPGVPFS